MDYQEQFISEDIVCNVLECPIHERCIHFMAYENQKTSRLVLKMLNSGKLEIGDNGCSYAHIPQLTRIARGFRNMYSTLPKSASRNVCKNFPQCTSRRQFYRLLNGEVPFDPEYQHAILTFFADHGANTTLGFDEYEEIMK